MLAVLLILGLPMGGCDTRASILSAHAGAAEATGRAGTAAALAADFDRGLITFSDAMDVAGTLLEPTDASDPTPGATIFAGAVLDWSVRLGPTLPQGADHEIFWHRVGQLAYDAAYIASEQGRAGEAWTLVLAGPDRWKRDSYWRRYPNHDALVSILMSMFADAREAQHRLDRRGTDHPAFDDARAIMRDVLRAKRDASGG